MLGNADGNLPDGFAVLDVRDYSIAERWERERNGQKFMYDLWYQPRQNTLVSSEWGAPNTFLDGFDPADVAAGKYGRRLNFCDLERRAHVQTIDLGDEGLIPLEIRWQHDPDSAQGFVGATPSSTSAASTRERQPGGGEGDRHPQPGARGLVTGGRRSRPDHGPGALARRSRPVPVQLAARRPAPLRRLRPAQTGAALAGLPGRLLGRDGQTKAPGPLNGGPHMLQNSLDASASMSSNSLFSTSDNHFDPGISRWLTKLDRQPDGSHALDPGVTHCERMFAI